MLAGANQCQSEEPASAHVGKEEVAVGDKPKKNWITTRTVHDHEAEVKAQQKATKLTFDEARAQRLKPIRIDKKLEILGISLEDAAWLLYEFGPLGSPISILRYSQTLDQVDPMGWRRAKSTFFMDVQAGDPPPKGFTGISFQLAPEQAPYVSEMQVKRDVRLTGVNELLNHFLCRGDIIATFRYESFPVDVACVDNTFFRRAGDYASQLVIDLDAKTYEASLTLRHRYKSICRMARCLPVVIGTSRCGGLQLIWSLPEDIPLELLHAYARAALESIGLDVVSGNVEIFPAHNVTVRVPLGAHSELLDPKTLDVIDIPFADKVAYLKEAFSKQRESGFPFGPLTGLTLLAPTVEEELLPQAPSAPSRGTSTLSISDAEIFASGLSEEIRRYPSLLPAIRHLHRSGVRTKKELVEGVTRWLDNNHNGCSSRFLDDRSSVLRDIRVCVEKHLDWVQSKGAEKSFDDYTRSSLTRADYESIPELAKEVAKHLPAPLPYAKLVTGIADLLRYAGLKRGEVAIRPTIPIPMARMKKEFRHWTTNPKAPTYYSTWLAALEQAGILVPCDQTFTKGQCRKYSLNYTFKPGQKVADHEEEISRLLVSKVPPGKS